MSARESIGTSGTGRDFFEYLESASVRYGARFHVYCLMSNHFRLLVETPLGNLSEIMRHVNGAYTNYHNTKHQRAGHLLQRRYRAILVDRDEYAVELSRYVHLNPFRAKMVERPEKYRWSSYGAYIGACQARSWLVRETVLADFGGTETAGEQRYREFVELGLAREIEDPLEKVVASTVLGGAGFVNWIEEQFLKERPKVREVPAVRQLCGRPSLDVIRAAAEEGRTGQSSTLHGPGGGRDDVRRLGRVGSARRT